MVVYSGSILSVNKKDDVYSYLVEDKGRIIFTGNELPNEYEDCKTVDLKGGCLIPSFVDTHQHFASFSLFHSGLNVMEASSNKEILGMIKEFAKNNIDKILIAFGASPYSVKEGRLVNREELDSVCPDKPFFMVKYDGHACVLNTPLFNKIKDRLEGIRGAHFDTGEMNQEAFFKVSDYVTNSISIPRLIKAMKKSMDYQVSKGIGMVHTVSGVGFPMNLDITMEKFMAKSAQNGFQLRVYPQSMNIKVATSRHLPRIGGCFECALDGCYGSQDAAMNEPYTNDPENSGILYYSDEKVIDFCKKANRAGLQIEMHAIGDKAFDQACRAIKAALDDYPREDHRHGIIHACLPTEEGLKICKDYHIVLPMQVAFDNWKQEPMEYIEELLGKDRANKCNPIETFNKLGCVVGAGSDAPCTSPDPIVWLAKAVNHSNPKESMSIQDALRMCTFNGAYISFDDKERGSLEVGKIADMVILDKNIYSCPKDKLFDVKVLKTILGGKEYKPQKQSIPSILFKGIFARRKF